MSDLAGLNNDHLSGCACFLCDLTPRPPYTNEEWNERRKNHSALCRYCNKNGGGHAAAMNGLGGNCHASHAKRNFIQKNRTVMVEQSDYWSGIYYYNPRL